MESSLLLWLLSGDPAIVYLTHRDLLNAPGPTLAALREDIALSGWGRRLLDARDPGTGLWGGGVYSPKWTSTHYTLLEMKNLGIDPRAPGFREGVLTLLNEMWPEGGLVRKGRYQDLCVAAMILGMCCYAGAASPKMDQITDYILAHQFPDGGFNCAWARDAKSSSLHTTLTVLEAFHDCAQAGFAHRQADRSAAVLAAREFILQKRLFRSMRTGEVIDKNMLMLSYPGRWRYDVLRCLDHFALSEAPWDGRMEEALSLVLQKRRKSGRWPVQHKHAGLTHFDPEPCGHDSRMNTLRVLRVLRRYNPALYAQMTKGSAGEAPPPRTPPLKG